MLKSCITLKWIKEVIETLEENHLHPIFCLFLAYLLYPHLMSICLQDYLYKSCFITGDDFFLNINDKAEHFE